MALLRNSRLSRIGIVVLAAVMVEVISIVQYEHLRGIMQDEMNVRGRMMGRSMADVLEHTLELTETTMLENLWDVRRCMAHPDSLFQSMVRLIDSNPHAVGGSIAFKPYYYRSKGRLFEPYAVKHKDGSITVSQLAGPDHDYTLNEEYQWVLDHRTTSWTDPYTFGPDSLSLSSFSYPIKDGDGEIVAICSIDIDLTWLGDTLNAHQPLRSSFGLVVNDYGDLVAGPSPRRNSPDEVEQALSIFEGRLPASANPSISFQVSKLEKDPYWQVVQVYSIDETFAGLRKHGLQNLLLVLLGLAVLAFMINLYARNENKLRLASEEQARISGELEVARGIQQEMLPKSFPPFVYGSLEPAREVGGDLYDFMLRDGKIFFCIGDVSGKGVPSSMLMSVAHSIFRLIASKEERPAQILSAMNAQIARGNDSNMFMTFFVGCLDLYSGEFHYASAGHDKPFILTSDAQLLQAASNLPLGVFPDTRFEEHSCTLAPGTTLLLYTDGLTEAKNKARKAFGRDGMAPVLDAYLSSPEKSLKSLVTSLSEAAHRFAGEAPQSDDLTLLAVRFAPEDLLHEQITLRNTEADIPLLGTFMKDFLAKVEADNRVAAGIRLAVEEAVVNVMNYAYPAGEEGSVLIKADSNRREVRFTIVDSGFPFDPTTVLEPDTTLSAQDRPIGGLGVLLSRRLMDSMAYSRRDGKNVLSLTKFLR